MKPFLISCDERTPGHDYAKTLQAMAQIGAVRLTDQIWLARLPGTALELRDVLRRVIGADDRLVVIELSPQSEWAAMGEEDGVAWLHRNLPAPSAPLTPE